MSYPLLMKNVLLFQMKFNGYGIRDLDMLTLN